MNNWQENEEYEHMKDANTREPDNVTDEEVSNVTQLVHVYHHEADWTPG